MHIAYIHMYHVTFCNLDNTPLQLAHPSLFLDYLSSFSFKTTRENDGRRSLNAVRCC